MLAGPMNENPERYVEIANDVIITTTALLNVTEVIFAEAKWQDAARTVLQGVEHA
ncbi:MAG: hypothetical protein QOF41_3377 [Methylobacteriaceae bacterium]|nr:hypothetical protein [Methylobacteriaceae bacterium]